MIGLTNLTDLKMVGNPLCDMRHYRLRVLENLSIKMLDDVEVKPRLRVYLAEMERRAELEDIMEATTQDYMDSIALQRERRKMITWKSLKVAVGTRRRMSASTRTEMENELQECISYIHSLDVRDDLQDRARLTTEEGLSEYKQQVSRRKIGGDRARRAYIRKTANSDATANSTLHRSHQVH